MTEAEWLACGDPERMLEFVREKARERKCRLFAVATCRHSLLQFAHYDLDEAVDWAETAVDTATRSMPPEEITGQIGWATGEMCESLNCLGESVQSLVLGTTFTWREALSVAKWIATAHRVADMDTSAEDEARAQADFLRDVLGNPFCAARIARHWLTSDVIAIATGSYLEKAFDRLPILADALEDAGCADTTLLTHLRSPGTHVRGCWALDLVMGWE